MAMALHHLRIDYPSMVDLFVLCPTRLPPQCQVPPAEPARTRLPSRTDMPEELPEPRMEKRPIYRSMAGPEDMVLVHLQLHGLFAKRRNYQRKCPSQPNQSTPHP